jgi:hypothetical protein
MRALYFICLLCAVLVSGCDPTGLRRVQLQLYPSNVQASSIAVDAPDVQEALQIIDAVVLRHSFHPASQSEQGFVRVYLLSRPPVTVDGRVYSRTLPCRVRLTATGLEVTFGNYGLLGANPEAASLFDDVSTVLIKRYGKKNIKSHVFGDA